MKRNFLTIRNCLNFVTWQYLFFIICLYMPITSPADTNTIHLTKQIIRSTHYALQAFRLDVGRYPSQEEGLSSLIENQFHINSWNGPYFDDNFSISDAWGNILNYRVVNCSKIDKNFYFLYSFGYNGIDNKGKGDDIFTVNPINCDGNFYIND